MGFHDKGRRLVVGNYDTFTIPIVITNHLPQTGETFVFTIRRVSEVPARLGRMPNIGDIVFQQTVPYSDMIMIKDENNQIRGCYFFITATKIQAAAIPAGLNSYDLAYLYADTEKEMIPPSEFYVGEVLR